MHDRYVPTILSWVIAMYLLSCSTQKKEDQNERRYKLERVGKAQVVQLYADGFDRLTPKEKIFSYYLSLAAIAGRDVTIDQHHF